MKKYIIIFACLLGISFQGCQKDSDFLTREPTNIIPSDQVWTDEALVLAVLADLYSYNTDFQHINAWPEFASFDEAFASSNGDYGRHQFQDYNYDAWNWWDYGYIRHLNLFIQRGNESTALDEADKNQFLAEARFLRSTAYFELVKRMGGVPLVLEPMEYDYSGDPAYLRQPRAKESEIYDFVLNELDEIKSQLPSATGEKARATRGAALAMRARVALYAGSIAKYGTTTPSVTLPGGEVGIPAERAPGYYQEALESAQEIITSGGYSLYLKKPDDLADNFASIFYDKLNNPEVIFARDYKLQSGVTTGFTIDNQPRSLAEEAQGGRLNPSLNLVQSFERLDNTFAPYATNTTSGGFVYYDNIGDIFQGRDARLGGTVILPGSTFKSLPVDIWAGYQLANGSVVTGDAFGQLKTGALPGVSGSVQVVGKDGPIDALEYSAQTGFYIRKFLDPKPGSGQIGTRSDVWWVRYRYSEVLLNAAEAAFELDDPSTAAGYINQVRERAGFTIPLTAGQITFDRIVNERKVELAFEGHQLWDMKRWRIADKVWNGNTMTTTSVTENIGSATKTSTMIFGLWPYKYHDPGNANHGKYIFKVVKPSRVTLAHRFRLGNYYSFISDGIRNNNPLIIRNPNQ